MLLFSETVFLRIGPLFRRLGPRVSLIRTFSKTQRTYSNETPGNVDEFVHVVICGEFAQWSLVVLCVCGDLGEMDVDSSYKHLVRDQET